MKIKSFKNQYNFQERLEAISSQEESIDSLEWKTIVVALGLTLVHECAHLMMRWTLLPFQHTPANFDFEAGEYIEKQLFRGLVSVIAEMDKDSKEWDGPNVPIKCEFSDHYIQAFFYIGIVLSYIFFSRSRYPRN